MKHVAKHVTVNHCRLWNLAPMLALVLTTSIQSCKKDNEPPPTTFHLNLSTNVVQAPAAAGSVTTVNIESNTSWKVTAGTTVDWVEVNKTAGEGNDNIQVKVTKDNTTGAKRTATFTVSLLNGKAPEKHITVEQGIHAPSNVTIDWKKVLGGSGNDYGYSIIKTADGGYLLSGRTSSNNNGDVGPTKGGIDMWVVKLDASGSISWQKTFGGNADEYSVAAAQTTDGGYVLTGYTLSSNSGDVGQNHGNTDFWVIKINSAGALQWQKTLGGNADDRPFAVAVTTEGTIGVAGYTTSNNSGDVGANHGSEDIWVAMLENASGNFIWKKSLGGTGTDIAKALVPAPDGSLFIGGSTSSNNNGDAGPGKGSADVWILRVSKEGSIIWKNSLGGTNIEELNSLALGTNNTLVGAGSTKSNNTGDVGSSKGGEDMWILQLNAATGALNWQKVLGGAHGDVAKSVLVRNDGSIVVAGYAYSSNSGDVEANQGAGDFWIVQLNANGAIGWKKTLGGNNEDLASALADSGDGGFAVAGSTLSKNSGDVGQAHGNSDTWIVKLKD